MFTMKLSALFLASVLTALVAFPVAAKNDAAVSSENPCAENETTLPRPIMLACKLHRLFDEKGLSSRRARLRLEAYSWRNILDTILVELAKDSSETPAPAEMAKLVENAKWVRDVPLAPSKRRLPNSDEEERFAKSLRQRALQLSALQCQRATLSESEQINFLADARDFEKGVSKSSNQRAVALSFVIHAARCAQQGHTAHQAAAALLVNFPGSAEAREWENTYVGALTEKESAKRIEGLIDVSRMERGLFEARKTISESAEPNLQQMLVRALVRNGEPKEAVAVAERMWKTRPDDFELSKSYAWALGKDGQLDASARVYKKLGETSHEDAVDACFLSAFLDFEANNLERSFSQLKACTPRLEGHKFEVATLWLKGWILIRQKRWSEAVPYLNDIVKRFKNNSERSRYRFWLGKALSRSGKPAAGRKHFQDILRVAPLSYYGFLARRELGESQLTTKKMTEPVLMGQPKTKQGMKKWDDVFAMYVFSPKDAQWLARTIDAPLLEKATMLQRHADYFYSYRRGMKLLPYPRVRGNKLATSMGWRGSYAEPHRDIVLAEAKRNNIAPSFVYAIMRTESGFLEDAVSHAGAMGLLQLMPYTARGIARKLKRPLPSFDEVIKPKVVIPLGAAVLATSQKEFGTMWLAAACYNGAPQNVATWLRAHQGEDALTFVENIPFKETRDYVKKILAAEAIYRGLRTGTVDMDFDPDAIVPAAPLAFTQYAPDDNED